MRHRPWLGVIFVLGLGLRMSGIAFGLPYHHHWDEWWIIDSVLGMVRRHDTVPASYQYGEPLMWITEAVFLLARRVQHATGPLSVMDSQSMIYLAGRVATALVSATGTIGVYLAASHARAGRWSASRRGLCAALIYAVSPVLVLHARYAVTDACLVALTAWTFAFGTLYLERGRLGWGIGCICMAGFTCAFKMPGVVTTLVPLLAALSRGVQSAQPFGARRQHFTLLIATVPAVAAMYVVLNPHVVDHSQDALRDLIGRYKQTRDGGFSSVYLRTPGIPHLASAIAGIATRFPSRSTPISIAVILVSAWGLAKEIRRGTTAMAIAAIYAVCLILSVALPNRTFLFRNYLVVVPSIAMGFGAGVVELSSVAMAWVTARGGLWQPAWVGIQVLVAALLVGLPVHDAIEAHRLSGDPRVRAIDWIASDAGGASKSERVTVTPGVFGKLAPGGAFPELRGLFERPNLNIDNSEIDVCPMPSGGPKYILDATLRDARKAPVVDPWQPVWLFQDCPGYDHVGTFEMNQYEVDLSAYPTWPGRGEATVLRRRD